jgi:hypothetical protein
MATVDLTVGGTSGYPAVKKGGLYRITKTVDFNANNEGGANRSAADVLQLIDVPANTNVLAVGYVVETAEGGTLTFDLGDGDDVDGYVDGADGNAAGGGVSSLALTEGAPNTITGYSNGKYYSAADTIDMVVNNDADAAKITVVAFLMDLSANG